MLRILVTGATGFIGAQVVRALIEQGHAIRVVVRPGKEDRLPKVENLEAIPADDLFQASFDSMRQWTTGIDTIIHVAWYAEPGVCLTSDLNTECLVGSLKLAKAAIAAEVRRFVGVGSCFEYRFVDHPLDVHSTLDPQTPYAMAKVAAFYGIQGLMASHRTSFAWCRPFYLYGEGEHPKRLVPYLHQQLAQGHPVDLTSGNQVRDFIDVRDAGQQIAHIALSDRQGPQNICTGKGITVRQLALDIAQQYGRPDLLRFGARPDNLTDPPFVVGIPSIPTTDSRIF
jgi:dTDP-6-deoxy-L-talose 4-dehydrogenase (NAD+)